MRTILTGDRAGPGSTRRPPAVSAHCAGTYVRLCPRPLRGCHRAAARHPGDMPAPGVRNRQRQRIGGIGGPGARAQLQNLPDHLLDLVLRGSPVTGDGRLDLTRRVGRNGYPGSSGRNHSQAGDLSGAGHRTYVVLGEYLLNRYRIGLESLHPLAQLLVDVGKAVRKCGIRGGADHVHLHQAHPAARAGFDHPDSAPGQAGVYAEDGERHTRHSDTGHPRPVAATRARAAARRPWADVKCPGRCCPTSVARRLGVVLHHVPVGRNNYTSTAASTSSEASKLAYTFCTSSLSSRASRSRSTWRAPSSSTSIWVVGTKEISAES